METILLASKRYHHVIANISSQEVTHQEFIMATLKNTEEPKNNVNDLNIGKGKINVTKVYEELDRLMKISPRYIFCIARYY